MILPRLEIRTQEAGQIQGDLVWSDRSYHCVAGSVVDLIATMAKSPNLPKDVKDWIGDTFWEANEKLKEQIGSLVAERDGLEKQVAALQDELKTERQDKLDGWDERTDQIHNYQIEIQALKDQVANFQDDAIDADTTIRSLEIKISEANQQVKSLETDNLALRAKVENPRSLAEARQLIDLLIDRLLR